jgi:3-hydroxybutyryl-CoA dehydrogenase
MKRDMKLHRIGVIGAGTIGTGVITDLVMHGLQAVVVDQSPEALARSRAQVLNNVRLAPLMSKTLPRVSRDEAARRLELGTDLGALATCDFIVENVYEEWRVKKPLYEQLDRIVPPEVCLGPNTSCIPITQIAAVTRRPDRVIGIHFMNPVHLMPTAEVIRGFHTSDLALETLLELFALLGKHAVMVQDAPGFVSNRISHLFMNEAAFVLHEGVGTASAVDEIFRKCFGHKMGPLETADLIGLDTVMRSLDVLYESFQDPKYRCCPLLRKLVQAGHLGRKTGRGFHEYPEVLAERQAQPAAVAQVLEAAACK